MKFRNYFICFICILLTMSGCQNIKMFRKEEQMKEKVSPITKQELFEITLPNGLKVLINENHSSPVVAIDAWINVGSLNEGSFPEVNGITHFLEHMMFKGTKKRPVGELDKIVDSIGAEWNAATSEDFTHYYIISAKEYIETALDVLSDILINSTFDANELEKERQVVLEEYRRKEDNPPALIWTLASEQAYKSHPYKMSVLGKPETINNITQEKMFNYYNTYYTPDNMVLILSGDIKPNEVLSLIEKYFGEFKRKRGEYRDSFPTEYNTKEMKVIKKEVNETYFMMTFPAPSIKEIKDIYVMDVLLSILSEGRTSKFYHILRDKKKLVSAISASFATQKDPGLFNVYLNCKTENIDMVEKEIKTIIQKVQKGSIKLKEIDKARKLLENTYKFNNETNEGRTGTIGFYYIVSGSKDFELSYIDNIKTVTIQDVVNVANKNLKTDNANIIMIQPQKTSEKM